MRTMKGTLFAAAALVALVACNKEKAPEAMPAAAPAPAATAPTVSSPPSAATMARAAAPAVPKKGTTSATSIASGPMTVNTAQAGDAGDSSWTEQVDVDGDSTAEQGTFVWDDEVHILYIAVDDDEVCASGGTAVLNTLTALFGNGNAAGAPVGSGWTATYANATQCGATEPVLWGERFDASGNVYAAGVATIDPTTGDLVIVAATDSTMAAPAAPAGN